MYYNKNVTNTRAKKKGVLFMNMKLKRFIALALAALMLCPLFAACGDKTKPNTTSGSDVSHNGYLRA